jgi:hypothetical protein
MEIVAFNTALVFFPQYVPPVGKVSAGLYEADIAI